MRLEDVSGEQWHLLATVFHEPAFEPWTTYAERVYCIEPQLDRELLRPDFLHRLIQFPRLRVTHLCGLHKILDGRMVHQIFVLVATEVGLRLNGIAVAGRDRVGHQIWDRSILNLRSLHGAWLHPELFWDTFGSTLDVPPSGHSQEDYMSKWVGNEARCEGCILSQIGGDLDTVLDLRMVVKSRTRTRSAHKHREPRLGSLIDGWLRVWESYCSVNEWQSRLATNDAKALHLKEVRKGLGKQRKRQKSGGKTANTVEGARSELSSGYAQERSSDSKMTERPQLLFDQRPPGDRGPSYLSPGLNRHEFECDAPASGDDDDDDDRHIRDTVHQAENDVIDCYAALISTPFLPGMGVGEHRKRTSVLSRFDTSRIAVDGNTASFTPSSDSRRDRPHRAQHQQPRRFSNYSESVYSEHPEMVSMATHGRASHQRDVPSMVPGSQSVQGKRASDGSWVTASVPPSEAATSVSGRTHHHHHHRPPHRSTRHRHRIDTITEELGTAHKDGGKYEHSYRNR